MKIRVTTLISLALLQTLASGQDKCVVQGQAEQNRIQREFANNRPAKGNKDTELAWARDLNSALAVAAKRAEDCARASRQITVPAAAAREQECAAKANSRAAELDKRYRGRSLSSQEQAVRRSEEDRMLEERMACIRGAGK